MHGHACDCGRPYPDFLPPKPQPAPKLASFSQVGHTLTDADIERVARRVVEMLAEKLK